jgi:hypothetical protein
LLDIFEEEKIMKKLILILSFTVISFTLIFGQASTIVNLQEPQSFRSQALGGTIDDDLDLIYDPIELRFVNGIRLYTNLSNLITSNEYILDNYSVNEFLAGISLQNPFSKSLWHAALVQYKNDRYPVVEYSKTIDNDYLDTGTDGLIDTRYETTQERESYNIDKRSAFILNNSYVFGDLTFGLRFATAKESGEATYAGAMFYNYSTLGSGTTGMGMGNLSQVYPYDPSFSNNFNSYLVGLNNFRTMHWDETGEFLGTYELSYSSFTFSAMKPIILSFDTLEVRGDIQYIPIKETYNQDDAYSGHEQVFRQDNAVYENTYQESNNLNYDQEIDGSILSFNLGLKQVFKTAAERKNNGFWELNAGITTGSGDYLVSVANAFNGRRYFFDGTDTLLMDYSRQLNEDWLEKASGEISISAYYGSFRINLPLGDRVYAGAGISLVSMKTTGDLKYVDKFDHHYNEQIIDTAAANDFVEDGTSQTDEDMTMEEYLYNVTIPVGIEYKFTNNKKWSLRFGSIFSYSKWTYNWREQNTRSEPYYQVTQYADGSDPIVNNVSGNSYTSISEQQKEATSSTIYVYGLGFQATDNLQIDLLGYLGEDYDEQIIDARFLRHLRLSFTLKF